MPITPPDLADYPGRTGTFTWVDMPFNVTVRVLDCRVRYGAVDFLIEPVSGAGAVWVLARMVALDQVAA